MFGLTFINFLTFESTYKQKEDNKSLNEIQNI